MTCIGQQVTEYDSVEVRILNKGKHYIKNYVVSLNGTDYSFHDIWRNKYSDYQKLPYLWPNNKTETQVIVKKMIQYDQWLKTINWPIDHVGESKYLNGKLTIEVKTKVKSGQLEVENIVIKE